jgi:NtrC-family two-component system sensor histidine kinase KinB
MLSAKLVRPLKRMIEATQKIAMGNYSARLLEDSSVETARLASEFNAMAERLEHYNGLNIEKIVSEKSKSEAMLASIKDGIIVLDTGLRITDINQAARNILGFESANVTGRTACELIDNEEFNLALKCCFIPETNAVRKTENQVVPIGASDQKQYFSYTLSPIETAAGDYLGVVVLLRDITRLKELDHLKSEFVMSASHELKTPLTSIGMSVDLLIERANTKLDSKEQLLLATAREEVVRLKALVNELLDLSRIESGKIAMEFSACSLHAVFEKILSVFETQAAEKNVELSVILPEEFPDVYADASKITWVLTNLVGNSLRYVEEGGHIMLSSEKCGDQAQVSVSDDGRGIPIEYQSRVFDKFVRVREGNDSGGSGLGLAICKEIVRAHKGAIWVDSMPGKGCTFSFTLPVSI